MQKCDRWPESELIPGNTVFEVGAYEGAWVKEVADYDVWIEAFEPDPDTIKRLVENVSGIGVRLHDFGLGARTSTFQLGNHNTDGASFCKGDDAVDAKMVDIDHFFYLYPETANIKIMRINIEGGEYELLSRMIDTGHITKVKYLMIHWHDIPKGAMAMRLDIERDLLETHIPAPHMSNPTWDTWTRIGV